MKGVRIAVLQFEDITVDGHEPMTPFVAVIEDVPNWKEMTAKVHGVDPSRMHAVELNGAARDENAVRWPLHFFIDLYRSMLE